MKRVVFCIVILIIIPLNVIAKRGCCSHHGGVAGCNENGRQICNDGTLSPTCTCTPAITYIYGCTDSKAKNYNPRANKNDGTCEYYKYGCIDEEAKNYDAKAEKDDGTCEYYVYGCIDEEAKNYDAEAEKDDGTCEYEIIKAETLDKNSDDVLPFLTIGGIGASFYYLKKKKSRK